MSSINKNSLEHLANLARIELHAAEEEKLMKDLEKILEHFNELKEIATDDVPPMTGGTELKSVMREDTKDSEKIPSARAVEQFPDSENGFLKVPPVFE
jgi:aspartyl-tRNA(Asn)/glutamyl-tRNA(Gln) amidotransferase subunit C